MAKRIVHPLYQDVIDVDKDGNPVGKKTEKGGKGSGHYGHAGLAGVWGGSSRPDSKPAGGGSQPQSVGAPSTAMVTDAPKKVKKDVLGSPFVDVDDKYKTGAPPDSGQMEIDLEAYLADHPEGGVAFELSGNTLWQGINWPKWLFVSRNPTAGAFGIRGTETEYRVSVLSEDGEPLGHYSPNDPSGSVPISVFASDIEEMLYTEKVFGEYPNLVGEIIAGGYKEFVEAIAQKEAIALKGGKGSGNWGHGGLAGVHGGSSPTKNESMGLDSTAKPFSIGDYQELSVPDRKKKFFSQPQSVVDAQANSANYVRDLINERIAFAGERPNTGDLRQDLFTRAAQYGDFTTQENKDKILDTVLELEGILGAAGVNDDYKRQIVMDAMDALVVQDNEALARQLGDHGIHHIKGNIETSYEILKVVPGADSPQALAEVYLAHIYHDTGYLTEPSQNFLDDAHPRWSRQYYDANVRQTVAGALGKDSASNVSFLIESHASAHVDWKAEPVASAVRVSDNLGLFQKEKLPGLFRIVPENVSILELLQKGKITEAEANTKMIANINGKNLSPEVRSQLIKAARECNRFTPKFTLGMMGGNIDGFDWSNGSLRVYLRKNSEATRLQKVMDLGQRQFAKFAETYGVDWKKFRGNLAFKFPPDGHTLLEAIIVGEKERKVLTGIFKELLDG